MAAKRKRGGRVKKEEKEARKVASSVLESQGRSEEAESSLGVQKTLLFITKSDEPVKILF